MSLCPSAQDILPQKIGEYVKDTEQQVTVTYILDIKGATTNIWKISNY